ncbi:hypothetical protein ACJJTC_004102 [Scirpophaga incertulas]
MFVNRSPPHSNSGLSHTGSQPDLSSFSVGTQDSITLRKRKQPDSNNDLGKELADFRSEIMTFLCEFKVSNSQLITDVRSDITELNNKVSSITISMTNLSIEHNKIKSEVNKVTESVNFLSNSHDDIKTKMSCMTKEVIELKKTRSELKDCKSQLVSLQKEINLQQQRDRLHNIEISGIPIKNNEDVVQYLMQICRKIDVPISTEDIIHIHRVPTRLPNKPKNIIAKLKSQLIKDSIISAIRKNKGLSTSDIGLPGDCQRIYINEHLTPYFKKLYKQARDAAAQSGYAYVWIRGGKIFMRKNDTTASFVVTDYSDLNKVKC